MSGSNYLFVSISLASQFACFDIVHLSSQLTFIALLVQLPSFLTLKLSPSLASSISIPLSFSFSFSFSGAFEACLVSFLSCLLNNYHLSGQRCRVYLRSQTTFQIVVCLIVIRSQCSLFQL